MSVPLKITFLGTGTSHGVPVIACNCKVCTSNNPKDKRSRISLKIESNNTAVVIDAGPDFRTQMLNSKTNKLDALLLSHEHRDHIAGLDDIRVFNYQRKGALTIYCQERVRNEVKAAFSYIFNGEEYPGKPQIKFQTIYDNSFSIGDLHFETFPVQHYKIEVSAFRINNFAFVTDVNYISEESLLKLKNLDVLVLGCLRVEPHISHFSLKEAIEMAEKINAKQCYFIHMSHDIGLHNEVNNHLPKNIQLAYDGLQLSV